MPTKEEVLLQVACLTLGIIPIEDVMHLDVRRVLAHMSEEDSRKLRRKFRKVWRWAARQRQKRGLNFFSLLRQKLDSPSPTRAQMRARKYVVRRELLDRIWREEEK